MPTYDYECRDCGGFDALRALARRDDPAACPHCGEPAPRVLVASARLNCLQDAHRRAHEVNDRASHEPRSSRDYPRLAHPAGCGCCRPSGQRNAAAPAARPASQGFPSKRPWMISH